jgi:hypothetical protein
MRSAYLPDTYQKYAAKLGNKKEEIGWVYWDTVLYTSGATIALRLFNAVRATRDVGNMPTAGALPGDQGFLIRAIRFYVKQRPESMATAAAAAAQPGALDNISLLINTGVLLWTIGGKNYAEYPLWSLPSGGGVYGNIAVNDILVAGAAADFGNCGYPDAGNVFTLTVPTFLEPNTSFWVDLVWPAAVALTRNVNVCVAFEGRLVRAVQ